MLVAQEGTAGAGKSTVLNRLTLTTTSLLALLHSRRAAQYIQHLADVRAARPQVNV
ncbi:hypothetical protein [Streptomyces sp. MH60]|uniref:hypothetical protein n=1 Tax=Streptomyces sp. MH60 TaxID=1940758 RepID=UPI00130076CC|nr:hypothetical protein [Streptomyces sp. MH60]